MSYKYGFVYEHKTASGDWARKEYLPKDAEDYERCVRVFHENMDEYRIIDILRKN